MFPIQHLILPTLGLWLNFQLQWLMPDGHWLRLMTYSRYLSGKTSIGQLARNINGYLETEKFANFIDGLGDGIVSNIAVAFSEEIPDIVAGADGNVGEKLSELFQSIILDAAKGDNQSTNYNNAEAIDVEIFEPTENSSNRNTSEESGNTTHQSINGKVIVIQQGNPINQIAHVETLNFSVNKGGK